MSRATRVILCGLLTATSSCTSYLVMTSEPRYAGQPHQRQLTSLAGGNGTSPHPGIVASECDEGQLAMVRITRGFGEALVSFLSLGLYAPATVHYYCATPPPPAEPGTFNTNGGQ
jgi:hypothetical protein